MTGGARDQILARIRAANGAAAYPSADADAAYEALSRRYLRAHHDPAEHEDERKHDKLLQGRPNARHVSPFLRE